MFNNKGKIMNFKNLTILFLALSCNTPVFSMQLQFPEPSSDTKSENEETNDDESINEETYDEGSDDKSTNEEISDEDSDDDDANSLNSEEPQEQINEPRITSERKLVQTNQTEKSQSLKCIRENNKMEKILAQVRTIVTDLKYKKLYPNEETSTEKKPKGNFLIETVMHPLDNSKKALALFGIPAVIAIIHDAYSKYCSKLTPHHKKLTAEEFVMDLLKNPTKNMLFTGTVYGLLAGYLIFGITDLVAAFHG